MGIVRHFGIQVVLSALLLAISSVTSQAKDRPLPFLATSQLYATSDSTLYRVNQHTEDLEAVGDLGVVIYSLTCDMGHDVLYGLGHDQEYALYIIDRHHAKAKRVGSTGVGGPIAYDNVNDLLYLANQAYGLYTINPQTAESKPLGGFFPQISGLAFDKRGMPWASIDAGPIGSGWLDTMDIAKTQLHDYSFMSSAVDSICFEPFTGFMYGVMVVYGQPEGQPPTCHLTYFSFDQTGVGENRVGLLPGLGGLTFVIDKPQVHRLP